MIFRDRKNFLINSNLVINYLQKTQVLKTEFAAMCEISIETLNKILKNKIITHTQERFDIMAKIMGVSYYDLVTEIARI